MDDSPLTVRWPKAERRPKQDEALLTSLAERASPQINQTKSDQTQLSHDASGRATAAVVAQGTCIHAVNGVELVCCPDGVVYWPATETLIVADLHLEKGSSFAARGQLVPPYDTRVTLRRLRALLDLWQPKRVIALGDSFHDETASERLPDDALAALQSLCDAHAFVWIAGNHDPKPPVGMKGAFTSELREGGLIFRHEPSSEDCLGEVAGHLHPKARLYRKGRVVRRVCFAASRTRMILPSFGAYTGGLNVFHPAFDGLFDECQFHALMCGKDQVYRIGAQNLS